MWKLKKRIVAALLLLGLSLKASGQLFPLVDMSRPLAFEIKQKKIEPKFFLAIQFHLLTTAYTRQWESVS